MSAARKVRRSQRRRLERLGVAIDGGIGASAMAAILAMPPGPARAVEAARWARLAVDRVELVAVIVPPDAGDDWVDGHAELMLALQRQQGPV